MSEELFEEVYYSNKQNKLYVVLIAGNRIIRVMDDDYLVQWTPQFEREFEQMILLGDL